MELGRLEQMDLREVWAHEAASFTPWLAANLDRLSDALGLQLTLVAAEQPVGRYSADILARDESDRLVVIENMLAASDHGHVGQLVTYASGLDVAFAVLVAPVFRDEHRTALTWLNDISGSDHGFFGVEVRAVRIGDSLPAPLFDVVVRPDEWQRHVREAAGLDDLTPIQQRNIAWWEQLLPLIHERFAGWTAAKSAPNVNWFALPTGRGGLQYSIVWGWTTGEGYHLRVEFYIHDGDKHFHQLEQHRGAIDSAISGDVVWDELPDAKASRIAVYLDANPDDRGSWGSYQDWTLDRLAEFRAVIQPLVSALA